MYVWQSKMMTNQLTFINPKQKVSAKKTTTSKHQY